MQFYAVVNEAVVGIRLFNAVSTGCGQKNTPLQRSHYFQNNLIFFGEIFRGYS